MTQLSYVFSCLLLLSRTYINHLGPCHYMYLQSFSFNFLNSKTLQNNRRTCIRVCVLKKTNMRNKFGVRTELYCSVLLSNKITNISPISNNSAYRCMFFPKTKNVFCILVSEWMGFSRTHLFVEQGYHCVRSSPHYNSKINLPK